MTRLLADHPDTLPDGRPVSGAALLRANALTLPLADESVDLIVTSPPYFALRSYTDGGQHYDGQIGSEPTPADFLAALWAVTAECWRVLKPTGSLFVNLGDKYAGSGGHNNAGLDGRSHRRQEATRPTREAEPDVSVKATRAKASNRALERARSTRRQAPDRYNTSTDVGGGGSHVRAKSLLGLPWRWAIGCMDPAYRAAVIPPRPDPLYPDSILADVADQWILRAELVWVKPNGLPESVADRVRRSHEQWFHLTKEGSYFAALDEIREPHASGTAARYAAGYGDRSKTNEARGSTGYDLGGDWTLNPLGKLPGSAWEIATEPLDVPDDLGVDHFAAFPQEWPRRLILGWSPPGICTACGEGLRPVVESKKVQPPAHGPDATTGRDTGGAGPADHRHTGERYDRVHRITGRTCGCPDGPGPTRPAVVLDPFGGTGTTAMVARALGRFGVSVDLSADYLRLARWRVFESGHDLKTIARTHGDAAAETERRRRDLAAMGVEELSLFEAPV